MSFPCNYYRRQGFIFLRGLGLGLVTSSINGGREGGRDRGISLASQTIKAEKKKLCSSANKHLFNLKKLRKENKKKFRFPFPLSLFRYWFNRTERKRQQKVGSGDPPCHPMAATTKLSSKSPSIGYCMKCLDLVKRGTHNQLGRCLSLTNLLSR